MQDLLSLHSLITPPVFRIALTERARLLELLRSSADLRLTLVDAPAGYGKTWLLASRYAELRASGARVVWLGANDSNTPELLTLLVHAFARAGLEVGHLETLADSGFSEVPVASAVRALVSMLAIAGVPVTIIIDDLHRLDRAAVRDVLAKLISDAPRDAHFLCGGADCSALPRGSLRVRGELREIGVDELRFTDDEAATLLTALNDSQRARLLARTEGWPVALQLARLWIAERPERSELVDAFSGRTSEVAE